MKTLTCVLTAALLSLSATPEPTKVYSSTSSTLPASAVTVTNVEFTTVHVVHPGLGHEYTICWTIRKISQSGNPLMVCVQATVKNNFTSDDDKVKLKKYFLAEDRQTVYCSGKWWPGPLNPKNCGEAEIQPYGGKPGGTKGAGQMTWWDIVDGDDIQAEYDTGPIYEIPMDSWH